MIKSIKSNKFIIITVIIMCIIFLVNPTTYSKTCLNAISVWSTNVLPVLFPFFIFTRIIVLLSDIKSSPLDKFFSKIYHTPSGSSSIYFLSLISGYPMGAKLISTMYDNKQIDTLHAKKLLSLCSVSGPMFILGTVGICMLNSFNAGLIILISNIISSLINGFIYRGKANTFVFQNKNISSNKNVLTDSINDAINSILMIGGFIVFSFILIKILDDLKILQFISSTICCVFNCSNAVNIVSSVLCGFVEITGGILSLSSQPASLILKTIISSGLIGFGGLSIFLQSTAFLNKLNIPLKTMLLQKTSQAILCVLISIPLCLIFL